MLSMWLAWRNSGFSVSFWQMIFTRCLAGALNGNVAVVRAALGDITDDTNSTDGEPGIPLPHQSTHLMSGCGAAFAMYGLVWVVGSIVGNTIGGFLSHPVERMPHIFGSFTPLRNFPFLLPCLVTTGITLCGLVFAYVALKEVGAARSFIPGRLLITLPFLLFPVP